jgi:ribonuclease HI
MGERGVLKAVTIYTDGACIGNPGPGGYGAVMLAGGARRELYGGYRRTTNNRMELLAAIVALEALIEPCTVTLHSDSLYVVKAMREGWPQQWRANGWRRKTKQPAVNPDLWARLLDLCDRHDVTFVWVRGHAGNRENERCDRLAVEAALSNNLQPDIGYEGAAQRAPRLL